MPSLERVTVFCFVASYAVALALEIWHQWQARPILRLVSLGFGAAGLFAHTLFVFVQPLLLVSPFGSVVLLAWILAIFYLYGSIHHRRVSWGLFVLPVVLALSVLAGILPRESGLREAFPLWQAWMSGERFWGQVHGLLVLLAAVGVSVAFVSSVMYLVQAHRLRAKTPPGRGMQLLSLERLETMNRRALTWAFPLLTAGLLLGLVLIVHQRATLVSWSNPKLLSIVGLWLVFAILLVLRYAVHASGRQLAIWTIAAFVLMVLSLISPVHPFTSSGGL